MAGIIIAIIAFTPLSGCGGGATPVEVGSIDDASAVSRTAGRYFETYRDGSWSRLFVKGFDVGTSVPNRWPGEVAISKETYSRWFEQISGTGANAILVYTLLMPWFYDALEEFNRGHPGNELWLVQHIWPREIEEELDLFEFYRLLEYRLEIVNAVDALAGNADIPRRKGGAWGEYRTDVLPYTLGILVGREILYEEARDTNAGNPHRTSFQGRYVRTTGQANAVEVWCAEMANLVVRQVTKEHRWRVPVGFVSWPTLDPLIHPTELTPGGVKEKEPDDSQVLDPRNIESGPENPAGIFATYQVYPYYPEFMYREPSYASYADEAGVLRYGGYLRDFMGIHPQYPALIGEIGLSTSIGMAHSHPEGLNHGGITEQEQGTGVSRMLRAIAREGYAGAFVFAWQDEWAKKNWVTYPYLRPYDRNVYWHNLMDPEQNFGVLAMEPDHVPFEGRKRLWESGSGGIRAAWMDHDAAFLYIEIEFEDGKASAYGPGGDPDRELLIGIDTVGPDHGTTALPAEGAGKLPTGVEFLFRGGAGEAKLLVRPDYNKATSRFSAAPSDDPAFEEVVFLINRAQVSQEDGTYFPEIFANSSLLNYGDFMTDSPEYLSTAHWYVTEDGSSVRIRLPWTLINVGDPSSLQVIQDDRILPPGPAGLQSGGGVRLFTETLKGFLAYAVAAEGGRSVGHGPSDGRGFAGDTAAYSWKGWDYAPYTGRLKRGTAEIGKTFEDIETHVPR